MISSTRYERSQPNGLYERKLGGIHLVLTDESEHPTALTPLSRGILILLDHGPLSIDEITEDLHAVIPDLEIEGSTLAETLSELVDLGLVRTNHGQ